MVIHWNTPNNEVHCSTIVHPVHWYTQTSQFIENPETNSKLKHPNRQVHWNTRTIPSIEKHTFTHGRLDLAVLFTPSTLKRQNRNQVCWNICTGVLRRAPPSEVVQTEQPCYLFQRKMAERFLHVLRYLYRLIWSWVLHSAQFYLF